MINLPLSDVRIFLCATPIKMQCSFDTLMGLAQTVFDQDPLSKVVAEFNRYNRKPQLHVLDDAIGQLPYSGAFDANDPESLIKLLELDENLKVEKVGDEILLRRRVD